MKTYNEIYLNARKRLRDAGIAAHDLEARLIVAFAAGKSREELLALNRNFVLDGSVGTAIESMLNRRLSGEPVAYIVGEWEFYGLPLTVNKSVLIPRVDTEVLAEDSILRLKKRGGHTRLLDLCAGSGAIGLAVAANVPDCRAVLADASEAALKICRANMLRNRLSRSVTVIMADALEPPPSLLGTFDAIVCNPPYIPTGELDKLDASVRDWEPSMALDGGESGFDFFRAVAVNWASLLRAGGFLAFECGMGQSDAVCDIMNKAGFINIVTRKDTLGIERVITGVVR